VTDVEGRVRVGLTLPSFVRDVDEVLTVAVAAEEAELDGVFVYDHLFRFASDGSRRPALELTALLGAVAAETSRIHVGPLVARATLRPPAITALTFSTAHRLAGRRFIGALGTGDHESRRENETFGLEFGTIDDRLGALVDTVRATRDHGFPVWVGGTHARVREIAAEESDGWNRWGGDPAAFGRQAASVAASAVRAPFVCSWGGLVVLEADDERAREKAHRLAVAPGTIVGGAATAAGACAPYVDAGASWLIAGPVDSRNPANAAWLSEVGSRLGAQSPK
jgi:alkanesulfonate monooxygenase SsuD/methylene tetrahydromethanopterin reductase-like flavin-dependent oxidoreductase (luciferase family)